MSPTAFKFKIDKGIAILTLDTPQTHNALARAFWSEIKDVFAHIAVNDTVRVVVIKAEGKHFSSGIDKAMLSSLFADRPELEEGRRRDVLRRMVLDLQESINVLETCDVPVLAAIQGACIGGALDLICAADCRFATSDAFFCVKETELGFTADLGVLQRLPRLIPEGVARELAYSGRKFTAEESLRHGLVNTVYDTKEALDAAVDALAAQIAARSPLAIFGTKQAFRYSADHTLADALQQMALWQSGMALTTDVPIAVSAQQQRQKPLFQDMPKQAPLYGETP